MILNIAVKTFSISISTFAETSTFMALLHVSAVAAPVLDRVNNVVSFDGYWSVNGDNSVRTPCPG
jgi:hypothetical protein